MDKKGTYAMIFSGIAIFFGIIATFTSRPYNWDLDFVGVAFSIMFALITLLVAWNIYTVIDTKDTIVKMKTVAQEEVRNAITGINNSMNAYMSYIDVMDEIKRGHNGDAIKKNNRCSKNRNTRNRYISC